MFLYLSILNIELDAKPKVKIGVRSVVLTEALFYIWVGLFAGLTFLVTLALGIFGVLSLKAILYIYLGISVVTLLLAGLLYFVRSKQ